MPTGSAQQPQVDPKRLDELLERVRRNRHRMGADVPYWVQDMLDMGYVMIITVWGAAWRCTLLAATVGVIWDIYAIGRPPLHVLGTRGLLNVVLNVVDRRRRGRLNRVSVHEIKRMCASVAGGRERVG